MNLHCFSVMVLTVYRSHVPTGVETLSADGETQSVSYSGDGTVPY